MSNRISQNTGLPVGCTASSLLPVSQASVQIEEIEGISLPIFKQPQPVGVRKVASLGEVPGISLKTYQLPSKDPFFIGREDLLKGVEERVQDGQVVVLSGMEG